MLKKRYIAILGLIVYIGLKVYVSYTENPNDDDIPDRLRDIVLRIAMLPTPDAQADGE